MDHTDIKTDFTETEYPLISVIVPVYNSEKYLDDCIRSLLNQTYKNIEIILIDSASADLSQNICEDYAEKFSNIRFLKKSCEGVSASRNMGLDSAKGEYISFVDSDDVIEPDMLSTLYNDLKEHNSDMAVCSFLMCDGDVKTLSRPIADPVVFSSDSAIRNALIGKDFAGQSCNKLFKAEKIGKLRFNREIFVYEDLLFVIEVMLNCKTVVYHSLPLYHYILHSDSAFHKSMDDRRYSAHTACLMIKDLLAKTENSYAGELSAAVIICNLNMIGLLTDDKATRKKYLRTLSNNIKENLSPSGLKLILKKMRVYAVVAAYAPYLYILYLRCISFIKKIGVR